jgi:hypothetical protein
MWHIEISILRIPKRIVGVLDLRMKNEQAFRHSSMQDLSTRSDTFIQIRRKHTLGGRILAGHALGMSDGESIITWFRPLYSQSSVMLLFDQKSMVLTIARSAWKSTSSNEFQK